MDIHILVWINTLALLAGGIIVFIQVQKIAGSLRAIVATLDKIGEALSRVERISLATLERIAPSGQAS